MSKRDYYDVLGVARGASEKDLKAAYRKLAKQYHPDRNRDDSSAEQRFKEVNEAYDALKDPQKRAAYDQFGHAAFEGGGFGAQGARGGPDVASAFADVFDDLFGDFMGGGGAGQRRGQARMRGSDLRYNMSISLEDAFKGKQERITIAAAARCDACSGSGSEAGAQPQTCPTCSGAGKVRAQQGFFTFERSCVTCGGRGQIIKNPCSSCGGQGRVRRERTLDVSIPAGIEDGARIRLQGHGEAGALGGQTGDLYIFIDIKSHPIFRREGPDLFCKMPLPMTKAALGGHIDAPTIDGGKARVTIPQGAQSGKQFRLRGKGMPVLRSTRTGDLYIEVQVETPVNLSARQKELLEEFQIEADQGENSPESTGFFKRVRDFWEKMG